MMYIIGGLVVALVAVFGVMSMLLSAEKHKAEKEIQKTKNEEVKKNEVKESLNGGNHHDAAANSLDLLHNNKTRK